MEQLKKIWKGVIFYSKSLKVYTNFTILRFFACGAQLLQILFLEIQEGVTLMGEKQFQKSWGTLPQRES